MSVSFPGVGHTTGALDFPQGAQLHREAGAVSHLQAAQVGWGRSRQKTFLPMSRTSRNQAQCDLSAGARRGALGPGRAWGQGELGPRQRQFR